jgi:hypothetical protein
MMPRDGGRDRKPAATLALSTARSTGELAHGSRQPRAEIGNLDADVSTVAAADDLDLSPAVLDGVGDQVSSGLREAVAITEQ